MSLLEGAARSNRSSDVPLPPPVSVLTGASLYFVFNHWLQCSSAREKLGPLWLWVEDEPHEFSSACFPACVASLCVADGICGPVESGALEAGSHAELRREVNSTFGKGWCDSQRNAGGREGSPSPGIWERGCVLGRLQTAPLPGCRWRSRVWKCRGG